MARKQPAKSFTAKRWSYIDDKRIEMPEVVFHLKAKGRPGESKKVRKPA